MSGSTSNEEEQQQLLNPVGETNSDEVSTHSSHENPAARPSLFPAIRDQSALMSSKESMALQDFTALSHHPRSACGIAHWGDDKVILVGGIGTDGTILDSVELYYFPTKTWFELPSLQIARSNCATIVVHNKLYVFGGANASGALDECEVLDLKLSTDSEAGLPRQKNEMLAVRDKNEIHHVDGNSQSSGSSGSAQFNKILETIERMRPMKKRRLRPGVAALGHSIIIIGGQNEYGVTQSSCESFDTLREEWTYDVPDMPSREKIAHVFAVEPNQIIVLTTVGTKLTYNFNDRVWNQHDSILDDVRGLPGDARGTARSQQNGRVVVFLQDVCGADCKKCRSGAAATNVAFPEEGADVNGHEEVDQAKVRGAPFVFLSYRGPETSEEIAWPTHWFLTKILKRRTFMGAESAQSYEDRMKALKAAHLCTHALVILSPDFRKSKWSVKELNTFMSRREHKDGLRVIPALFGTSEPEGYPQRVRGMSWLENKAGTGAADYMIETLWPYLVSTVGNVDGDRSFSRNELKRFLWEYVSNRSGPTPDCLKHFVIREWLLQAVPRLPERDLSQYTRVLFDNGFDSLKILRAELLPEDLDFMKDDHRSAAYQFHFMSQEGDERCELL